ncbi:MAG: acylneuraminate cytidylyltransferase [Candidatus Marinimicrobia bacterium]|nr:acylneuraminate cytidylyltransferase [Candidatus Neomarinimicrobiota bacterium]
MSDSAPSIVALIPARSGSKRIKHKNIRRLGNHPLIAYSIASALDSGLFASVIVSTDSKEYRRIAEYYGAWVPFLRSAKLADDHSPDIEWVNFTLRKLKGMGFEYDCFSILRPTSPFRSAETVNRAWIEFLGDKDADSLRAVEKCYQHPAKMWFIKENRMKPVLEGENNDVPWHNCQYQTLPEVYAQNASLEIARTRVVFQKHSITGDKIMPFYTKGFKGIDVNREYDWDLVQKLIKDGKAQLPIVEKEPYPRDGFDTP